VCVRPATSCVERVARAGATSSWYSLRPSRGLGALLAAASVLCRRMELADATSSSSCPAIAGIRWDSVLSHTALLVPVPGPFPSHVPRNLPIHPGPGLFPSPPSHLDISVPCPLVAYRLCATPGLPRPTRPARSFPSAAHYAHPLPLSTRAWARGGRGGWETRCDAHSLHPPRISTLPLSNTRPRHAALPLPPHTTIPVSPSHPSTFLRPYSPHYLIPSYLILSLLPFSALSPLYSLSLSLDLLISSRVYVPPLTLPSPPRHTAPRRRAARPRPLHLHPRLLLRRSRRRSRRMRGRGVYERMSV
jgi:hypothetical protein